MIGLDGASGRVGSRRRRGASTRATRSARRRTSASPSGERSTPSAASAAAASAGVEPGGEDVGPGEVDHEVDHVPGAGQEAAQRAQGLGQRSHPHQGEVGVGGEAGGEVGAEDGVGFIEQEQGAVAAAQGGDLLHRCRVAVHGEDRVGDHDGRACAGARVQQRGEMRHVAVAVDRQLGPGQPAAVDDRGVVQLVREDPHVGPPRTLSAPRLAAKPVGKQMAASVPFHSARATSNAVCTGRDPVTSREAPGPGPPALQCGRDRGDHDARVRRSGPGSRWRRRRPPVPRRARPPARGRRTRGAPASGRPRRPRRGAPAPGRPSRAGGSVVAAGVGGASGRRSSRR